MRHGLNRDGGVVRGNGRVRDENLHSGRALSRAGATFTQIVRLAFRSTGTEIADSATGRAGAGQSVTLRNLRFVGRIQPQILSSGAFSTAIN